MRYKYLRSSLVLICFGVLIISALTPLLYISFIQFVIACIFIGFADTYISIEGE